MSRIPHFIKIKSLNTLDKLNNGNNITILVIRKSRIPTIIIILSRIKILIQIMNKATQIMLIFNKFLFRELARGIWDYFA